MKKTCKILFIFFIAFAFSMAYSSYVLSATEKSLPDKMGDKFARGTGNFFTGPVEIPVNISKDIKTNRWGYCTGLVKGVGYGLVRSGVGLYEAITFPLPLPSDYEPIMEPVYAWE